MIKFHTHIWMDIIKIQIIAGDIEGEEKWESSCMTIGNVKNFTTSENSFTISHSSKDGHTVSLRKSTPKYKPKRN